MAFLRIVYPVSLFVCLGKSLILNHWDIVNTWEEFVLGSLYNLFLKLFNLTVGIIFNVSSVLDAPNTLLFDGSSTSLDFSNVALATELPGVKV